MIELHDSFPLKIGPKHELFQKEHHLKNCKEVKKWYSHSAHICSISDLFSLMQRRNFSSINLFFSFGFYGDYGFLLNSLVEIILI